MAIQTENIKRQTNHFVDELKVTDEVSIISPDFKNRVLTHVMGNFCDSVDVPLFLAIHGNPGEGKTFQTFQICAEYSIKVCYFSGAELSGNYEKDSILDLQENYTRACNYLNDCKFSVIIIDDFHLSPASTKVGVGITINSQLLTGYLMNLCDKALNGQIQKIPIILLGNTFINVYEPLKRDGRMDFFYWESPFDIKREVAVELLSPYMSKLDRNKIDEFVEENKDKPVSFFAEVKNDIDKKTICNFIEKSGKKNINHYIKEFNNIKPTTVTIDYLRDIAMKRRESTESSTGGGKWVL